MSKNKHTSKARDQKYSEKQSRKSDHKNLRESINDYSDIGERDLNIEIKSQNMANRMINVFNSQGHGKPIAPEAERKTEQKNPDSILSQYLFKENTKKESHTPKAKDKDSKKKSGTEKLKDHLDEKYDKIRNQREYKRSYLSTISTRYNPDMIVGGSLGETKTFIRGNEYFMEQPKPKVTDEREKSPEEGEFSEPEQPAKDDKDEAEDSEQSEFDRLQKVKGQRYWAQENITMKCHNCKQFGHMARECPNDTKRLNCILCGKDTHESFDCNEKMCFKCNKIGHQARDCNERDVVKCGKCNHVGHRENRCLKEWNSPNENKLRVYSCIECGKEGHIKCTKEANSWGIKINTKVLNDLNEFILQKFREAEHISESEEDGHKNPEVDAFDYVNQNKKQKKTKKLTKTQK